MSRFLPLAFLVLFAGFFALAIVQQRDPSRLPSVLIGTPLPDFKLAGIALSQRGFSGADIVGRPAIVNFFASWCLPCRVEQPVLMGLRDQYHVPIFGVNYKDKPEAALAWLKESGNPFAAVGADPDGRLAINMGVAGVPESFVIDRHGNVIYRHAGPVTPNDLRDVILPLLLKEGL